MQALKTNVEIMKTLLKLTENNTIIIVQLYILFQD